MRRARARSAKPDRRKFEPYAERDPRELLARSLLRDWRGGWQRVRRVAKLGSVTHPALRREARVWQRAGRRPGAWREDFAPRAVFGRLDAWTGVGAGAGAFDTIVRKALTKPAPQ